MRGTRKIGVAVGVFMVGGALCPGGEGDRSGRRALGEPSSWSVAERFASASSAGRAVSYGPLAEWLSRSGLTPDVTSAIGSSGGEAGPDPCAPMFNGCGPVDFLGALANCPFGLVCFEGACNVHDICYDICGVPQLDCDFLFLVLMLGICQDDFAPGTEDFNTCNNLAFIYYVLVRVFGETFYMEAQERVCQCVPNGVAPVSRAGGDRDLVFAPPFADADGDLMPDDWERRVGLDATRIDSFDDSDGDGLFNIAEYMRGTDPFHADSDGDGVYDDVDVALIGGDCCAAP